jgi:ubiquinone/menaquinone biosynthesis C-methylase UbiE
MQSTGANVDGRVVEDFGYEWERFDQTDLSASDRSRLFHAYFDLVDWTALPANAVAFDVGCGSGRWAAEVAPRVGTLHCIDPAEKALSVARRTLAAAGNCAFHQAAVDAIPLPDNSADFGYSIGVLHHVPDTAAGIAACVRKLKPGAPFLVYLYYSFENRPAWFRAVWKASDLVRVTLAHLPRVARELVADAFAFGVYWPLSRAARVAERSGANVTVWPLSAYRTHTLSTMRNDALDRFGTKLEQRFSRAEIADMMLRAGLTDVRFSNHEPYWVAIGRKR